MRLLAATFYSGIPHRPTSVSIGASSGQAPPPGEAMRTTALLVAGRYTHAS